MLALLCLSLLAGCARQLPLTLPPNAPAQVTELSGAQYTLDPASDGYRTLERWISNNRAGWSWGHYYATPPPKGVIVRAGALYLQFFDSTALARTPQGDYRKSVSPSDYAFLTRHTSGT
jgi:predicted small lipoprotein YifL